MELVFRVDFFLLDILSSHRKIYSPLMPSLAKSYMIGKRKGNAGNFWQLPFQMWRK